MHRQKHDQEAECDRQADDDADEDSDDVEGDSKEAAVDLQPVDNGLDIELSATATDEEVEADTVVMSVGNRSERELYDELKGKLEGKQLYFIGDAVAPRLIQQAVLEAEELARTL